MTGYQTGEKIEIHKLIAARGRAKSGIVGAERYFFCLYNWNYLQCDP